MKTKSTDKIMLVQVSAKRMPLTLISHSVLLKRWISRVVQIPVWNSWGMTATTSMVNGWLRSEWSEVVYHRRCQSTTTVLQPLIWNTSCLTSHGGSAVCGHVTLIPSFPREVVSSPSHCRSCHLSRTFRPYFAFLWSHIVLRTFRERTRSYFWEQSVECIKIIHKCYRQELTQTFSHTAFIQNHFSLLS